MKNRLLSLTLGLSMIFTNVTAIHAEDSLPSKDSSLGIEEKNDVARKNTSEVPQSLNQTAVKPLSTVKAAHGGYRDAGDSGYFFDFETDPEEAGWTFVDADGDGYNWYYTIKDEDNPPYNTPYDGVGLIVSQSYDNDTSRALEPDNWAISPKITVGTDYIVAFMAMGQDASYAAEVFGIYAIPVTSDAVPAPDAEWVKIGGDFTATGEYVEYVASLAAFAGQDVRIAIRHYNISDMFMLNVDNFSVIESNIATVTFDLNDGTGNALTETTTASGRLNRLPLPLREYFKLLGWFTDPEDGEEITTDTVFTEDTVVYAHWEKTPAILGTYFETAEELEEWSIVDLDGDGYYWNWYYGYPDYANEGSGFIMSDSYISGVGALDPDNWIISPVVSVPHGDSHVQFYARARSGSWPDVIAAYAIEADQFSDDPDDWTKLTDDITTTGTYTEYTADLNEFAGKDIYIAIRHYNCKDMYAVLLDTFEALTDNILHTIEIADDIDGGSVKTNMDEAYYDETVILSYETDPDYEFVSWNVTAEETGEAIEVSEDNTFVMPDDNVIVSAVFEPTAVAEPAFKATSLLLTGQIGVVFYYDLPQTDAFTYDSVDFTVTMPDGKTETSSWSFSEARVNEGMYGFVCYVNSIQMADEITAVLNYTENGEEKTLTDVSSVKEYIENSEKLEEGELTNAQILTHAVADFGHYAQVYLSDARGWTIGTDYANMDKFYSDDFNAEVVRAAVDDFMPVIEKGENELASISYSLGLDSSTTLYIYANTPSDYTGSITAYCGDVELASQKVGKSCRFAIPDIKASHLADMYDVIIESDNERASVSLAALSYVGSVIDAQLGDKANDAVSAFYYYYAASLPYRMNPRN